MENLVGNLILKISTVLSSYINKSFSQFDEQINVQQLIILMILWQKDGQRQQNIADISSKDKTSTARLIAHMEKKKLLERRPDLDDTRQKLVFLTDKSNRLKFQILSQLRQDMNALEEGIDKDDLQVAVQVLKKIYLNINKS